MEQLDLLSRHGANMFAIGFATLFMGVVYGLAIRGLVPAAVPGFYAAASVVAAIAYRLDKSAAERDAWRTSERMLHFMALLGGWPGALVAQEVFRHKSRKLSFRFVFWTTVALNCAALTWFTWMAHRYR
jgi:uncharacterized membrane protein YsdA (DUF1294 family)